MTTASAITPLDPRAATLPLACSRYNATLFANSHLSPIRLTSVNFPVTEVSGCGGADSVPGVELRIRAVKPGL
jgi:hypothetical protein